MFVLNLGDLRKHSNSLPVYGICMAERILSHLHLTVGDRSKSLRTVIPSNVVKKLNLTPDSILEWVETGKGIFVKRL